MKTLRHAQPGLHLLMLIVAFLFLAPLLWMLATAFKRPDDIITGLGMVRWWPHPVTLMNFRSVLGQVDE